MPGGVTPGGSGAGGALPGGVMLGEYGAGGALHGDPRAGDVISGGSGDGGDLPGGVMTGGIMPVLTVFPPFLITCNNKLSLKLFFYSLKK